MSLRFLLISAALPLVLSLPAAASEIHQAVAAGDLNQVTKLLNQNPNLVSAQEENQTRDLPLHTAATHGQVEIAKLLLKAGADIDGGDIDGSTPLGVAAIKNQKGMVTFLLANGADVNKRDKNGAYSLSFAAFGGDAEIVQILIEAGADFDYENPRGVTLLHAAASRGLPQLFDQLVARGDDVNTATTDGETPLHWAAYRNQTNMLEKLLAQGANPSPTNEHGQTPLMQAAFGGQVEVAQLLINAGADVNARDLRGNTALLSSTWRGQTEYAKLLIANGADPNCQNEDKETPLIRATSGGYTEMVELLLTSGAKCDQVESHFGCTPLHIAATRGYADITELLLQNGASITAVDGSGRTALQLAACYGEKHVAKLLVAGGAGESELKKSKRIPNADCKVAEYEAVVWYLGHSSWAVKTQQHLVIFDYWDQGRTSDDPGLCNGHIRPAELADLNVAVFASHEHGDHYDPLIFTWREELPQITYILGFEPEDATDQEYILIPPRQQRDIAGMKVSTIESNDSGVGFVVELDGLVIYHAGDHANRQRDFSGPYKTEIDYLAAKGVKPDMAFMPISGCGFGDQEAVKMGVHYVLETLKPTVFIPMHAGNGAFRYHDFIADCKDKFPKIKMVAVQNRGDYFRYSRGDQVVGMAK